MKTVLMIAALVSALGLLGCLAVANALFERMLTRSGIERRRKNREKCKTSAEEAEGCMRRARRETLLACPHERWTLTAADGVKLHARCIPAEIPTDRWALCVHGYTSSGPKEFACFFDFYRHLGYNLLLPDHRAHGESEGEYVGMGVLDSWDIRLWIDELIQRTDGCCRIVLHGVSMGAATVTTIAGGETPEQVRGFLADCGYTSVWDEFAHQMRAMFHLPTFPILNLAGMICRVRAGYGLRDFSPMDAVKRAKKPMLFVHGGADDFVPTRMSRALYEACASEQKEILIIEGAAHATSYRVNPALYERTAGAFFKKIGMGD